MNEELKELLVEKMGVPDRIYETSLLFYDKIVEYLSNNKEVKVNPTLKFQINGDFNIDDFKFNESAIEFRIDYANLFNKKLTIDFIANSSKDVLLDKFKLNTLEYSYENNKTIFVFNYDISYPTVQLVHILNYFNENKNYLISSLSHELKHKFDEIKKPLTPLMKSADYHSYNYRSTIPSIDYFIQGMYLTSDYELLVKNSEFYAYLKQAGVTKETFNNFLINSEIYKTLNRLKTLTIEILIDNTKKLYMPDVDNLLMTTRNYINGMSVDDKINSLFKIVYTGISNLKLEYLNSKLSDPTSVIVNSYLSNEEFYQKEVLRVSSVDYMEFFTNKLKEINQKSNEAIRKLSKLYDMVSEERQKWKPIVNVKPIKWID